MANEIFYNQGNNLVEDVSNIVESAQKAAYRSVDSILVVRNWLLGKRIAAENMQGTNAERYGSEIIPNLSKMLSARYGKGFDRTSLYRYVKFYQMYPEIVATLTQQSSENANICSKI